MSLRSRTVRRTPRPVPHPSCHPSCHTPDDNGTVQGLIAAGMGSAVMPRLTVDASDPRVSVIELGNRVPPRMISLARHRDRYHSPSARAFVETALAVTAAEPIAA